MLEEIADLTRKFISAELEPHISTWEEKRWFPNSIFEKLGANGFLSPTLPEEFGGLGMSKSESLAWLEIFGETPSLGFTVAVAMSGIVCANAIQTFGTSDQKKRLLPQIASGQLKVAYAFTEPESGTDLRAIKTTAFRSESGYRVNGRKTFITNGVRADIVLTFSRLGDSFGVFIVPRRSIRTIGKIEKLGWHCSDTAILALDNSEAELLGEIEGRGWEQVKSSLAFERLVLTALGIGLVRRGLAELEKFATSRVIKGTILAEHPAVKQFLNQSYLKLKLFSHFLKMAAERESVEFSSALKAYVCDELVSISDQILQFFGGYGYSTDYLPERILRDIRLLPIGGGSREPLLEYVFKKIAAKRSGLQPLI